MDSSLEKILWNKFGKDFRIILSLLKIYNVLPFQKFFILLHFSYKCAFICKRNFIIKTFSIKYSYVCFQNVKHFPKRHSMRKLFYSKTSSHVKEMKQMMPVAVPFSRTQCSYLLPIQSIDMRLSFNCNRMAFRHPIYEYHT